MYQDPTLPSLVTSFHRQAHSERRFGMSSPSSSSGIGHGAGVPVATVAGIPATISSSSSTSSSTGQITPLSIASPPDIQTQRPVLEHLFDRGLVEGDFWYVIVAEWLEQLKKFIGISSSRKYYGQRGANSPGPIVTRRDYAHTVDVVHEDAWRMLVKWYGISDGHKPMKLVVYQYARGPEIEHNINSFKLSLSTSPPEDFHIVRFSKMEKIGYVEHKIRELYTIPSTQESRLWAKPDSDGEWRSVIYRDKPIGMVLDIDSDFTRPHLVLETCDVEGMWSGAPDSMELPKDIDASGHLTDCSLFDDVTTPWELDIHEQIDQVGKLFFEKLHSNFDVFVQRAKDYIEARECQLRERERQVCSRESVTERLACRLGVKEQRLNEEMAQCHEKIKEYESRRLEVEREFADRLEGMEKTMALKEEHIQIRQSELESEKEKFQDEMKRMVDLNKVQESRIKLDIGGNQYTTSLLTLTKDPNSMLAAMFSGRHELKREADGSYFVDRDGTHFRYVLNYLRDGCIKEGTLPQNEHMWQEMLTEAEFYQLNGLAEFLRQLSSRKESD